MKNIEKYLSFMTIIALLMGSGAFFTWLVFDGMLTILQGIILYVIFWVMFGSATYFTFDIDRK
jgi:hypothetical protein